MRLPCRAHHGVIGVADAQPEPANRVGLEEPGRQQQRPAERLLVEAQRINLPLAHNLSAPLEGQACVGAAREAARRRRGRGVAEERHRVRAGDGAAVERRVRDGDPERAWVADGAVSGEADRARGAREAGGACPAAGGQVETLNPRKAGRLGQGLLWRLRGRVGRKVGGSDEPRRIDGVSNAHKRRGSGEQPKAAQGETAREGERRGDGGRQAGRKQKRGRKRTTSQPLIIVHPARDVVYPLGHAPQSESTPTSLLATHGWSGSQPPFLSVQGVIFRQPTCPLPR